MPLLLYQISYDPPYYQQAQNKNVKGDAWRLIGKLSLFQIPPAAEKVYPGNIEEFQREQKIITESTPDIQSQQRHGSPGISTAGTQQTRYLIKQTGNTDVLFCQHIKDGNRRQNTKTDEQYVYPAPGRGGVVHNILQNRIFSIVIHRVKKRNVSRRIKFSKA